MTSNPEGNPAGDAVNSEENEIAAEVKHKAKARKKATVPVEVVAEVEAVKEFSLEPPPVKPAKEAAKKAAKKTEPAVEAVEEAQVESAPAEVEPVVKKPKAAKKAAAKKDKGRDLVVQEPGAAEVAEILHHAAEAAEAEAAYQTSAADEDEEPEIPVAAKGPEPKPERLQKILARAGISSRRKAEELILGGRVQINGQVVMELGTKADMARDHVRVDGKLLQGAERIRYFVLNKPKGFVTTVSDPEGRPTVMQFFAGERERLYPVGRLDYLSEGLLLVTNDGELANKLTKASSGVEKTYLVKVAGQPSEEGLNALRAGVVIEKGRGVGSGRVRTAPAQIRQVRQGDNPWFEVIVIEGRNRELRKMFEEIGHHVEKIRRIGYGPLILDQEPGKMRELEPEEVQSLRLASEGKLKTRRRRGPAQAQLPTVAGKTVRYKKADGKPGFERPSGVRPTGTRPAGPRFAADSDSGFKNEFKPAERRTVRPEFQQESKRDFNPAFKKEPSFKKEFKPAFKKEFKAEGRTEFKREARPEFKATGRTEFRPGSGAPSKPGFRAASGFKPGGAGFKAGGRPTSGGKPRANRPAEPPVTEYVLPPRKAGPVDDDFEARPAKQRSDFNPDYKPGFKTGGESRPGARPGRTPNFGKDRPEKPFRQAGPRADFARPRPSDDDADFVPNKKTPGFRIEPVEDKPRGERPASPFAGGAKPFRPASGLASGLSRASGRPAAGGDRPFRARTDRTRTDRPGTDHPAEGGRPFRPRGEFRAAPSRSGSAGSSERPRRFTPRGDGPPTREGRPARSFGAGEDRPREFRPRTGPGTRPRTGDGPPKKFAGAKPFGGSKTGPKAGPDGEPRKKERWRNSFTGKNKGRPKPKPKNDE